MNKAIIRKALELGLDNTNSLGNVTGNDHQAEMEQITAALAELDRPELGPFGCHCQTLSHRVTGDGCDICNPEMAAEIKADNERATK